MKKILVVLMVMLIPSFAFATTTTAAIGGTLKVYEVLSLDYARPMIWPAQYAGPTSGILYTSTGLAAANGITGTDVIGQAGRIRVNGTGGTQYTISIPSAFTFTLGGTGFGTLAPTTVLCAVEPVTAALCAGGVVAPATQTLSNPGSLAQSTTWFIQGALPSASSLSAGVYTGSTTVTVTY